MNRLGAASAARRRRGGALAQGRASETAAGYRVLRDALVARSGGWCEIHARPCVGIEVCHVVARSQGGEDSVWNCYFGCRCANLGQQAAFVKGRLICSAITRRGVRGIQWEWIQASGKVAYRLGESTMLAQGFIVA